MDRVAQLPLVEGFFAPASAFVEELDLRALGFKGVDPLATGRPAYHRAVLLKLYI
jgi:hypothetical protein